MNTARGSGRHAFRIAIASFVLVLVWLIVDIVFERLRTPIVVPTPASADAVVVTVEDRAALLASDAATIPATLAVPAFHVPLPPLSAPLADVADGLLRRADSGDSAAACRLGIELLRCQRLQEMTFGARNYEPGIQSAAELEVAGRLDDAERSLQIGERNLRRRAQCAMLAPEMIARGRELLRAAALAGESEALLRYADGSAMFLPGSHQYIASPEFDRWRREAPAMLRRALAAGRPEAALLLAGGYGGGEGLVEGLLPDDPLQAQAARLLATHLLGADPGPRLNYGQPLPRATLDPAAAAAAERLAAEWHQEHFAGATFAADTLLDLRLASWGADQADVFADDAGRLCGSDEATR